MRVIKLDEQAVCEVHAMLSGKDTRLAEILTRSQPQESPEGIEWRVPVTPQTVHCVESICMLADDEGCLVGFDLDGSLSERDRAFFEDVISHRSAEAESILKRLGARVGELSAFAVNCLKVLLRMGPAAIAGRRSFDGEQLKRVVLVGVYGGEHVGDIAILGGVLFRLHRQFGVREARLFSHQPEYTRRLTACLDTPVSLEVLPDQPAQLERALGDTDALFWAGGPLMDLPPVLVKQLASVYSVQRRGCPFFLEGVGVGPFRRAPSRWVARRIARSAARITVRTTGAARDPILDGIDINIGRDPAFDYLETRRELNRLSDAEAKSVQSLLADTDDRILVGINLRPIRHFWSKRGEAYSRSMEQRFMDNLAEGMRLFARQAARPVSYIFFPMNLIQIGYSDLAAAYRLQRLVGKEVDLRVWQADPDVDGVLHLLRKLDLALTMRFHASIFSLSQKIPTIGIDYYPGEGGKVEQLFHDLGLKEDVRRMDEVETEWLIRRLHENCPDSAESGVAG
jgi:polysaccharide pyruvyl transferase WcaK-like protein